MNQSAMRAAGVIAAVYGHFLIFAQFAFVELLRVGGLSAITQSTSLGRLAACAFPQPAATRARFPDALLCAALLRRPGRGTHRLSAMHGTRLGTDMPGHELLKDAELLAITDPVRLLRKPSEGAKPSDK